MAASQRVARARGRIGYLKSQDPEADTTQLRSDLANAVWLSKIEKVIGSAPPPSQELADQLRRLLPLDGAQ